jgi:DNA (cytosine-5)-methyltransferase 1
MNVLDLFSGACGGWSLGLHRAGGFRTVAACEVIPWRRQRFAFNFPNAKLYDDVQTLTADRLRTDGVGPIHVIAGSPPCQDASSANTVKGGQGIDGKRTGLFWEALRLVRELRPDWVFLENVPPLRTKGYDRIHNDLEANGYACRPLVVEAACAGAPHLRARVWIIANAKVLQWPSIARDQSDGHPERFEAANAADAEELSGRCLGPATRHGRELEVRRAPNVTEPEGEQVGSTGQSWLDALEEWKSWNGGFACFDRMDDGLPKGMARELLSAYGDAVVPVIPEIIGRSVMKILSS